MGAARYVGRVGGLAVALGVGLVVFTGHGVASADADTSTPASTSQNAGPAAPARPKHPKIHLQSPRQSTAASTANVTANLTKPTTARATNGVVKKAKGSLAVSGEHNCTGTDFEGRHASHGRGGEVSDRAEIPTR